MKMENGTIFGCPVAKGLESFGDAWSILILRDAHTGITRFDDFRKRLGIAPTILTKRLAALTGAGLLEKRRYSERPPRDEYILTASGKDFLPVLMLIGAWSHRHRGGALYYYIDDETGLKIEPIGIDAITGAKLGSRRIRLSKPATPATPESAASD